MFITGPVQAVLIPAVVALGMAEYLRVIVNVDANILGAVIIIGGAVIALFGVRLNAIAVTVLLIVEILTVVLVAVFGFINVQRPVTTLLRPEVFDAQGIASPLTLSALVAGIAVGSFAYNGFPRCTDLLRGNRRRPPQRRPRRLHRSWRRRRLRGFPGGCRDPRRPLPLQSCRTRTIRGSIVLTAIGGDTFNTAISLGIAVAAAQRRHRPHAVLRADPVTAQAGRHGVGRAPSAGRWLWCIRSTEHLGWQRFWSGSAGR